MNVPLHTIVRLSAIGLLLLFMSCASIGSPTGGPKDETPPVLLKSIPEKNATRINKNIIEIYFDELISVQNPSEKIIVSPPQQTPPIVKNVMKKIVVELQDSLKANETYTIDFTDAIVDYNESNPFGDYAFAFSTGESIDTLCLSGVLLNAENLNPEKGVIIGVHSDMSDSAFLKNPFLRVSKTKEDGSFCVKNLTEGPYKVYALGDQNHDFRFDQHGESIAFPDSAYHLWTEICQRYDTIWVDSVTVDTILVRDMTCFKPDDIVLRYFKEDFGRQYLVKTERNDSNKLSLYFGFKSDTLPGLHLLNAGSTLRKDWYLLERNSRNDSLIYWIQDSSVIRMDTLQIQIDYLKTDSLEQLSPACDTVRFFVKKTANKQRGNEKDRRRREKGKDNEQDSTAMAAPVPIVHLALDSKLSNILEFYSVPSFTWETPVREIIGNPWHLYEKIDTLWVETRAFDMEQDEYSLRTFRLYADWEYDHEYKFEIDSGMVVGIYNTSNNAFSQAFKIRSEKEYSRLTVRLEGLDGQNAFLEVIDKNDKIVRREAVVDNVADCFDMKPGDYYLRLIIDENDNFKWDTGCYATHTQPEMVYYNSKLFSLKANWEFQETWNILELPLVKQKPKELKPSTEAKRR